ncbi:NAD(P)/FAD-dependent oxidoreductase [Mycolicibacterium frederiksbergense]|uniref:NAD(P)/FAD-dependent oxidoreductase n=1 Tax=Mycolicibacterium frederiksbergense TaxID=117567 RepID=UPI00265BC530|nr:FAD-dependent oxidoreductase [Mycolicibacterium frederiksbergense]MDO0974988.1 FAD-dependent oxidoreductase [Mycolicibacterium frederiksbergense]
MERNERTDRSIAVIGSGVAGLTAAYVLSARNRVTLFEADIRLGGHAHTQLVDDGRGNPVAVDTAFLVHNDRTYPTLCRLFAELGVQTHDTDMSMSVRDDRIGLQYAGARGLGGLFPSVSNLARPRYMRMLAEVTRFHRAAGDLLGFGDTGAPDDTETLGAFLERNAFSDYFIEHFMTPLVAAVWSCAPGEAMRYPARYLFMFLEHHGMLTVFGSPTWKTVVGGSATYVAAVAERVHEVVLGSPAGSVRRNEHGVQVSTGAGGPRQFDAAVIATHPDQALLALAEPTPREREILGAICYSANHAQLHTDTSLLPTKTRARASWNYLATPGDGPVLVTYDISRLMGLTGERRFLVTLGGRDRVDPNTVIAEMIYDHPLYTPESVAAQRLLPTLDDDRVVFAGAYHGWGFHEDGAAAGLRAAERLGARWPTAPEQETVSC